MAFSLLHLAPSAIAAVLVLVTVLFHPKKYLKLLGYSMAFFAAVGLYGYATSGGLVLNVIDAHTAHAWIGITTLLFSVISLVTAVSSKGKPSSTHCRIGYVAAALSAVSLTSGLLLLGGFTSGGPSLEVVQVPASSTLLEVEATSFLGVPLTPLSEQRNNAIQGTQYINEGTYRLTVTGQVENELNVTLDELRQLPAYSEVAYLPCVEGWGFTAKWTGFGLIDLLNRSVLKPEASYVVFYSADGYSTGLPLDYIKQKKILLAYGINDLTLPAERGFPFQVVAEGKYGYKWAKWVTRIVVVPWEVKGFWESRGYSNSANAGEYPFE